MEHAYGLYTHIRGNQVRSAFLLIGLFFLVYVLVFAGALVAEAFPHGDEDVQFILWRAERDFWPSVPWATAGTVLWIFIAYKFHQSMIDALTGGELVSRTDYPKVWDALENLCISRGIPMPKLKVMDSDALNAFATGMNQSQYSITVTTGLIKALNQDELEAVLGHELTHIRNGDVRLMVIAMVIAGVVSFFGEMIFRMFTNTGVSFRGGSSSSERKGGAGAAILIAIILIVIAWLLSVVVRMALSRSREFLADAGSVELTKNPDAMISALRKIEGRGELRGATSAVMEMCVDNPREGFSNLFDTHPSVDQRVAALVKYAGGHDPGPLALPPPKETPEGEADENTSPASGDTKAGPWSEPAPTETPGPWGDKN
ncbi:MAG TPA: M48 family metallopeptidase [Xanthobacteraceae bacterium]|nr:M48 family metallopeptidase [Xanthobacteraceae bacterium]